MVNEIVIDTCRLKAEKKCYTEGLKEKCQSLYNYLIQHGKISSIQEAEQITGYIKGIREYLPYDYRVIESEIQKVPIVDPKYLVSRVPYITRSVLPEMLFNVIIHPNNEKVILYDFKNSLWLIKYEFEMDDFYWLEHALKALKGNAMTYDCGCIRLKRIGGVFYVIYPDGAKMELAEKDEVSTIKNKIFKYLVEIIVKQFMNNSEESGMKIYSVSENRLLIGVPNDAQFIQEINEDTQISWLNGKCYKDFFCVRMS